MVSPAQWARRGALVLALAATALWLTQVNRPGCSGCPGTDVPRSIIGLFVPVVIASLPFLWSASQARRTATKVAAALLSVVAVLGLFIFGWVYLPSAVLLWVAVALRDQPGPAAPR